MRSWETDVHTGRTPYEDEGRGWGDDSISQLSLKIACKPPEARKEARPNSPSQPYVDTWISDFWSPKLSENTILLLKPATAVSQDPTLRSTPGLV